MGIISETVVSKLRGEGNWSFSKKPYCMHCGLAMFTEGQDSTRTFYTAKGVYFSATKPCKKCGKTSMRIPILAAGEADSDGPKRAS